MAGKDGRVASIPQYLNITLHYYYYYYYYYYYHHHHHHYSSSYYYYHHASLYTLSSSFPSGLYRTPWYQ